MKDAAYVGVTTSVYREALDAAVADPEGFAVRPEWKARLEQSFSRSFTTAHLEGRHDDVRSGGRGGHRGVLVGRVSGIDEATGAVEIKLSKPVAEGDVVYLYTPWGQTEPRRLEAGGDATLTLRVRERVAVKDRLFRLAAADVGELARDLVNGRVALRPLELTMRLAGEEGSPARARRRPTLEVGAGIVTVATAAPLAAAQDGGAHRRARPRGARRARRHAVSPRGARVRRRRRGVPGRRRAQGPAAARAGGARRAPRGRAPPRLGPRCAGRALAPALPPARDAAVRRPHARRLRPRSSSGCAPAKRRSRCRRAAPTASTCPPATRQRPSPARSKALRGHAVAACASACPRSSSTPTRPGSTTSSRSRGTPSSRAASASCGKSREGFVLEYPLQGLNGLAAGVAAGLAGAWPAAVTASPEASLEEIAGLASSLAAASPGAPPAIEILAFGRQQVLHTRDLLGRAEGLYDAPGPAEHVPLLLEDAKGYEFPAEAYAGGTRIFNARVTNLAPNLGELREAGVRTFVVEQAAMDEAERAAFAAGGLEALAPLASRERTTTGHLFRGVA